MERSTRIQSAKLPNGQPVLIEIVIPPGEQEIAAVELPSMEKVTETIEGIAGMLAGAIERVAPSKASVEFGIDFSVQSGALIGLVVKGKGSGSLTITLEWERASADPAK